jgi:heterodisulfide reductase subunit A
VLKVCSPVTLLPTPAPIVSKIDPEKRKVRTITASCKGCGVCAARCPTMAIDMGRFTLDGIMAQIHAFGEVATA